MDFVSAFPAPFSYAVSGQDIAFSLLKSSEFASLGQHQRAEEWKRAQENPAFANFDGTQRYRVREEIDNLPRAITSLIAAARTDDGAKFYVGKSLSKTGYPPEQIATILEEIPPADLLTISLLVTRINSLPKDYKPAKPFDRPLESSAAGAETGAAEPAPTGR